MAIKYNFSVRETLITHYNTINIITGFVDDDFMSGFKSYHSKFWKSPIISNNYTEHKCVLDEMLQDNLLSEQIKTEINYIFNKNILENASDIKNVKNIRIVSIFKLLYRISIKHDDNIVFLKFIETRLHPSIQSRLIETIMSRYDNINTLYIHTHSDYIINAIRILVRKQKIDNKEVSIWHFNPTEEGFDVDLIRVDQRGELDKYPKNFMDEYSNQLFELI